MTSDAKMGLLLGLVIVVMIAFLLNGLPGLIGSSASETPVNTSIVKFSGDDAGINEKAAQAIDAICMIQKEQAQADIPETVRFRAPLPATNTIKLAPRPTANSIAAARRARMVKRYTVKDGDNLGSIAKSVYGTERGNKHIAVTSIFHANRAILGSPDSLQVGQQLIIPAIAYAQPVKVDQPGVTQRVRDFANKNLKAIKKAVAGNKKVYIVQPGDSLWLIAQKTLGDGSRYDEILRANSRLIDDEESISIGMKLKIPTN